MPTLSVLTGVEDDETLVLEFPIRGKTEAVTVYPVAAIDAPKVDAVFQFFASEFLRQTVEAADYSSEGKRAKAIRAMQEELERRRLAMLEHGFDLTQIDPIWELVLGPAYQQLLELKASEAQVRKAGVTALTWMATGSIEVASGQWSADPQNAATSAADSSTRSGRTGVGASKGRRANGSRTSSQRTTK